MTRKSYLTSRSFLEKAEGLARWSAEAGRAVFSPGRTALLIVDMQGWFLEPRSHAYLPDARGIVRDLRALAGAFSERGLPVVFTRHINTQGDAAALGLWWSDLIRAEDPLSEITDDLPLSEGLVVEKCQYDAFHGTGLAETLRKRGTDRIVVTGVATHLCCETTARSAFVRGFQVTFPLDGTATYDEEHHLATLLNLAHGFATVTTVQELLEEMRTADRGERPSKE